MPGPEDTAVMEMVSREVFGKGLTVEVNYAGTSELAATMSHYGLGWTSGEYRGLRVVSHAGGTSGFTAEVAFRRQSSAM